MTIYLKGAFRWRNAENSLLSIKQKLCLRPSAVKLHKRKLCRHHNLSENQVSTWKRQFLENAETFFESPEKHSDASSERIAQLEQLVGRLTLALEIQKKSIDVVGLNPSQQRHVVETLCKEYSMRQICQVLGFNKSTFYYQPRIDASQEVLRSEIQRLAAATPDLRV